MEIVIDTSVVIGFLRGHEPEASLLAQLVTDGRAMLTAVTVFELESGLRGYDQLLNQIATFSEVMPVLPLDLESARRAGQEERRLQQRGVAVGVADVLIAGICLARKRPLLTLNREHFSRIDGLRVLTPNRMES